MYTLLIFNVIIVLLIVILFVIVIVNSNNTLRYPSVNKVPDTNSATLTYYYALTSGSTINLTGDDYVLYQSIYTILYKNSAVGTKIRIGSYSSSTTIMGIPALLNCLSRNNNTCTTIDTNATKTGEAVLSISDGNISGTIAYILNNNPAISLTTQPSNKGTYSYPKNITSNVYFPNLTGEPVVYDIIGGTGYFLGKKGYIYISGETSNRRVSIYYK